MTLFNLITSLLRKQTGCNASIREFWSDTVSVYSILLLAPQINFLLSRNVHSLHPNSLESLNSFQHLLYSQDII